GGAAALGNGEGGLHPGVAVARDLAVDRVGAGGEAVEGQGLGLAGAEVSGDELGSLDGQVVLDGAVVADVELAAGRHLGGRDGELGHRHGGRGGGATTTAAAPTAGAALVDGAPAEADGDHGADHGHEGHGDGDREGAVAP